MICPTVTRALISHSIKGQCFGTHIGKGAQRRSEQLLLPFTTCNTTQDQKIFRILTRKFLIQVFYIYLEFRSELVGFGHGKSVWLANHKRAASNITDWLTRVLSGYATWLDKKRQGALSGSFVFGFTMDRRRCKAKEQQECTPPRKKTRSSNSTKTPFLLPSLDSIDTPSKPCISQESADSLGAKITIAYQNRRQELEDDDELVEELDEILRHQKARRSLNLIDERILTSLKNINVEDRKNVLTSIYSLLDSEVRRRLYNTQWTKDWFPFIGEWWCLSVQARDSSHLLGLDILLPIWNTVERQPLWTHRVHQYVHSVLEVLESDNRAMPLRVVRSALKVALDVECKQESRRCRLFPLLILWIFLSNAPVTLLRVTKFTRRMTRSSSRNSHTWSYCITYRNSAARLGAQWKKRSFVYI